LGSRFQNCAWQTYMIVEISFGLGDPKSSREHRRSEVLGARFAIASSDREDFQCERSPVIGCQCLVGFQCVSCTENCEIVGNFAGPDEVNERACSPGFRSGFDKVVALEIFAAQGNKQFTWFNGAGIGADLIDYDSPVPR